MTVTVFLTLVFFAFICAAAGANMRSEDLEKEVKLLSELSPETVYELRKMMFPGVYDNRDEEGDLWPAASENFYDDKSKNSRNFGNPFVIKKASEGKGKEEPATPRHFFRVPFILKRNQYQTLPFILKRNGFKNPFVIKRDDEESQMADLDDVDEQAMARFYNNPSIFKRLLQLQNNGEEEVPSMY